MAARLCIWPVNGHLAVVQYLVEEHGAQVDVRNNDGNTPLLVRARMVTLPWFDFWSKTVARKLTCAI